jgi:hypothetical protein
MALYANDGTGGRPGTRLATSNIINVINGAGSSVPNVAVTLSANTRYWISLSCGDAASVPLLQRADSSAIYYEYFNRNVYTYGAPMPNPFLSGAAQNPGVALSFHIQVIDVP